MSQKKSPKTWAFAGLVFLVVGYAIYDYKSSESETKSKEKQSLVLQTMADQIHLITLQKDSSLIELERDKEGWKLLKPVQDRANSNTVDQFLEGLATEKSIDTVVEGEKTDLSVFGLDQPMGVLTVTGNSADQTVFKIGKRKNFQGDAYLQKNDEKKVMTVSSTWFDKINKTASDFREKRLMRMPSSGVEKIKIQQDSKTFSLIKKDSDWILVEQPNWKLDQNKVRELLSMLNTTEALEVIAEGNPSQKEIQNWGLLKPRTRLNVFFKDHKQWSALLAAGSDKVHRIQTTEPNLVLKISPTDSDKFSQMSADYFRDHGQPFDFDKSKIQKIEISLNGKKTELSTDGAEGKAILSKLKSLQAFEMDTPQAPNLENGVLLKDSNSETVFRFQWGHRHVQDKNTGRSVYDASSSVMKSGFTILESEIKDLKLEPPAPEPADKGNSK